VREPRQAGAALAQAALTVEFGGIVEPNLRDAQALAVRQATTFGHDLLHGA
jgi:hypothetical protein